MGKAMVAAVVLLAGCSTIPDYSTQNRRVDPNAAAIMMMYGVSQFNRSIQPRPLPPTIHCYGGPGHMWCQ